MKNSICVIAIIMWLGLSSSVVNALSPGPIDSNFVDNTTSFNANFGNDSVSESFVDHFTFAANSPMFGAGGTSVISGFDTFGFEVHLDSIGLWDVTDTILVSPGTIVDGEFAGFASFAGLTSGHDYDIVVTGDINPGHTNGTYSGNISISSVPISPVPEPETYVMLLIGLCMVCFAARARKRTTYFL